MEAKPKTSLIACPKCKGTGIIETGEKEKLIPFWLSPLAWLLSGKKKAVCPDCNGTGKLE